MFSLKKMNHELLQATQDVWDSQLQGLSDDVDLPSSRYEQVLDYARKYVAPGDNGNQIIYGVVEEGKDYSAAILDMANARRSRDPSLKLLNIYLQPQFSIESFDKVSSTLLREVNEVLTVALTESVRAAFRDHGLRKLKVYGRTGEMLGFFDQIIANLDSKEIGLEIYKQGAWLVFDR